MAKIFLYPSRTAISILCGTALLLSGCHKKEDVPTPEVAVETVHPSRGNITEEITADAVLAPLAQAAIAPKVTAPIKRILVERGSHVRLGQLLATLEDADLRASALDNKGSYAAAQASFDTATQATVLEDYVKAQLDLAQSKATLDLSQSIVNSRTQLFAQGAIPGRDLDTAKATLVQSQATYDIAKQHLEVMQHVSRKAALESAQGQLTSAKGKYLGAEALLSYTEIRSPIDGIVTDRPLFAGETAAAGTSVITVMDTSSLLAKLHIAQIQAQRISFGASAALTVPGIEDSVPAKVVLISPALDPGSTTVEIWLKVGNPKGLLKVGTSVHAMITGRTATNTMVVPAKAIQTANDGTSKSVMLFGSDGIAHKHAVTIGIETSDFVQVLEGLNSSDSVIAMGSYALDDGTKVKIATPADEGKGEDKKSAGEEKQ